MNNYNKITLRCCEVVSGYTKDAIVIRDLSFMIPKQQIFAVLGKNGMGKTTLLKTIMGFLKPTKGTITFSDIDITGFEPQDVVHQGIAYVPQEEAIFQDLTVEENLRLALSSDRYLGRGLEKIAAYFPIIPERRRQKAGTLSGGEQKLLLMARALIPEPKLILIDEISEGLQPAFVDLITDVLQQLVTKEETTILLVEQNVHFVSQTADRLALIKIGQIVSEKRLDNSEERNEQELAEMMKA
jgi:branched-chain amino acid transport system ATP-binding protein